MKEQKNLLVFSNEDIYREVDIDEFEKDEVLCGNTSECDIRLRIKSVEEIIIVFRKINESWHIVQNEGVYYIANGIKTPRKQLVHGDTVLVKHNIHKGELFNISYFIDFKSNIENYDLKITLDKSRDNTFGCDNGKNIFIKNELLGNSSFVIRYDEGNWMLCEDRTKYGVYVNGTKVENRHVIQDNDFITLVGHKFFFKDGFIHTSKYDNEIVVNGLTTTIIEKGNKLFKYPSFLRSPRMILNYPKDEVEVLAPPQKPNKPNSSLLMSLMPIVGSLGLTLAFRTGMNGNNKFIYYSIGTVLLGATMTIINILKTKKEYEESYNERIRLYEEYISEKSDLLDELRDKQVENMVINYPDILENYNIVENNQRRLWERSPINTDFLLVRLGIGNCEPTFKINVPKRQFKVVDDPISERPYELYDKYKSIDNVPVMLSFKELGSIGVVGNQNNIEEFIASTTVDITAHHYSEEVKLVYITNENTYEKLQWLRWLPHTWSNDKKYRYITDTKESAHELIKVLYKMLQEREEEIKNNKNLLLMPHYIVYVTDRQMIENEPILQYIGREEGLGITFVFMYEHMEYLPKECNAVVTIMKGKEGKIQYTSKSEQIINFKYDVLSQSQYENYSKYLSPVYIQNTFAEDTLKKSITLFELYNIKRVEQLKLNEKWLNNHIYNSMAAPLGVRIGDELISLDLHEKYHGPHGLVAGTTGSGKSEILQSYVASMAINFHPHDVSFIVIDFKGGGMANQFKDLPHMVGAITNIDGNQIYRSLKSIDAELKKRQRVFAEYDVNHIDSYIKLYKSGKAHTPIPHLIMIVDEFAELKSEHPDFMAKLISTARIGRSLGVHLILATQKPAGVVDNQIWSNSKFKLCLKVQDKQDSNEVLKSPLAADIVDPGRAYLQVGNNEIFELFQSAWSGAKAAAEDELNKRDFEISRVALDGRRIKVFSTKDNQKSNSQQTELDTVINYINNHCIKSGINKLSGPWLPPLETHIYLDDILLNYKCDKWMTIPIGIYDDPDNQKQEVLSLDFGTYGHLMIIGSPTSGKTTFIQTLLVSLMNKYTPEDINIYILDFGSRILKTLEKAPHVGGVIISDEEEKMKNLMNFITKEITKRKDLFASVGVTSLASYRDATGESMPHIMIAIDNFTAMLEYFNNYEEKFISLSREGANLGITLAITATQVSSIRYRLNSNFSQRIALNCNDRMEYSGVIEGCRMQPTNVQGRGLISINKNILEFHTALPFEGETEVERSKYQKEFIDKLNTECNGISAKEIPMMPKTLKLSEVLRNNDELSFNRNRYMISIGVNEDDIEQKNISLLDIPVLSVVGKAKSGKTNFINTVAKTLDKNSKISKVDMYVFDSEKYGLSQLKNLSCIKEYISDSDSFEFALENIYDNLVARYEKINEIKLYEGKSFNINRALEDESLISIVVDDAQSFTQIVSRDRQLLYKFNEIIGKFKDLKISFIISGTIETFTGIPVQQAAKIIKEENVGLVFEQISNQRMFDFKTSYRSVEKNLNIGEAYFYNKGNYIRVKTAIDDI